jgi:hypothetical protein
MAATWAPALFYLALAIQVRVNRLQQWLENRDARRSWKSPEGFEAASQDSTQNCRNDGKAMNTKGTKEHG